MKKRFVSLVLAVCLIACLGLVGCNKDPKIQSGGTYFIDVSNIFRDFDADENDEKNCDFYYSDEYITAIVNSGAKIYYRLGVSIE